MMKHFLVACALLLSLTVAQTAHAAEWRILNFVSDVTVQEDATLDITEQIDVHFDAERRGIFRDLPYAYKDRFGQPYVTHISVKSVVDEEGKPHPYTLEGNYPFLRIRVGNPDVYLRGVHHYFIRYTVERAYTYQKEGAIVEIPWNVTGSWEIPLENVVARFHLPAAAEDAICFTGPQGSTKRECSVNTHEGVVLISPTGNLVPPYHQLTAALQLPASAMTMPGPVQYAWWYLRDNYMLLYALLMIVLMTVIWWRYGKEYPLDSVMPRWEVPGEMTPFHAHILHHDHLPSAHLSAGIIYLATRGYITISAIEKTKHFSLKRTEKMSTDLPAAEKKLYNGLFGSKNLVSTSDLKNKFYTHISPIVDAALQDVVDRRWFYKNPSAVRTLHVFFGILVMTIGAIWAIGVDQGIGFFGVLLAGTYWIILGLRMPKKTRLGRKLDAELRGLYEYIDRAEKLRLSIKNPPGHTRAEFDRLLPFAMAFGLEGAWAKHFEDILVEAPSWVEGDASRFTSTSFLSSLHSFSKTSTSTMTSSPPSTSSSSSSSYSSSGGSSFSSGGSSGGGFGGGGGGSW